MAKFINPNAAQMRLRGLCICVASLGLCPAVSAQNSAPTQPPAVIIGLKSLSYSDSFTIDGWISDLEGAPYSSGGDYAFTHNQALIGLEYSPSWARGAAMSFGLSQRYDYAASYSSDLADIVNYDANALALPDGDYALSVDINQFSGWGLWAGGAFNVTPSLSLWGRAHLLQGRELTDGTGAGSAMAMGGELGGLTLGLEYAYSEDQIFTRDVPAPDGLGAVLDIGLGWQASPRARLSVTVEDALSQISWSDAPQTVLQADTQTVSRNADGTLNVTSALSGENSFDDYDQTFEPRITTRLDYQLNDKWALGQDIFLMDQLTLYHSKIGYDFTSELSASFLGEWRSGALGAQLSWNRARISLMSDSFDFEKARYTRLEISYRHIF